MSYPFDSRGHNVCQELGIKWATVEAGLESADIKAVSDCFAIFSALNFRQGKHPLRYLDVVKLRAFPLGFFHPLKKGLSEKDEAKSKEYKEDKHDDGAFHHLQL